MALEQVSGAEKVGWSDAEAKNLAVGSSLPPDLLTQVAAVESPGEEVQARLLAGACNVNVRKRLSGSELLSKTTADLSASAARCLERQPPGLYCILPA